MKIKRKLDMDRYEVMLRDLEKMHETGEVSEQTYQEMKGKYEEKLKELEESYFEGRDEYGPEHGVELSLRIGEQVEEAVSAAMGKIEKLVHEVPDFEGIGDYYGKEDVYEGKFESDRVHLDFSTVNGFIEVKQWDNEGYKVVVARKARGFSREQAERRLSRAEVEVDHSVNGGEELKVKSDEHHVHVNVTAYLPGTREGNPILYDADLESQNGHITMNGITTRVVKVETENGRIGLEGIHTEELKAETENGRILLEDVEGNEITISTENGRLELLNVRGKALEGSTDNGAIRGKVTFARAELETENGSIQISPKEGGAYTLKTETGGIRIELDRSVPYFVEAQVGLGSIKASSDLGITFKGKHYATVKSEGYDTAEKKITIETETEMGSIRIE